MKKLSDFKDEEAIRITSKLMSPIVLIVADKEMQKFKGNLFSFGTALLEKHPDEVKTLLAILNDTDLDDYHFNAKEVFEGVILMLNDEDLLSLFGLQMQTSTSSASASVSSEVKG